MIPVKDEDDDEYNIKIDINIDIKDNEIEEIINKQIKDIKIDDNLIDIIEFDKDKYKDKLEKQTKNYISDIKKQLDLTIKKIYDEKTQIHKSNILNIIDNQNKTRVDIINNVNKNTSSLKNDFNELVNGTNEMKIHLGELKDNLEKNPNKKIYENNIVFDRNDDGDNDNDDDNNNDNDDDNYKDDENDDDDYNKIKVKFLRTVIKDEVLDTNCTSIKIDNIRIENIGNKTLDKLYFIRDEKNSSNEFIISQSTNINCCQLNSTGDKFVPGKIQNHSITLEIKKPIVDQTYYLKLYIRENKNGKNISKPLEIFYTINKDEEAAIRKKEEEEVIRRKKEEEEKRRKEEEEKRRKKEEEEKRKKEEEEKRRKKEEEEKRKKEEEEKRKKEEEEKRKKEEEEKRKKKEEEEKRKKEEEEKRKKKKREELSPATLDKEAIKLFNGLVDEYKYNIDLTNDKDDVYLKIIELNYDRNAVVEWINELMQ